MIFGILRVRAFLTRIFNHYRKLNRCDTNGQSLAHTRLTHLTYLTHLALLLPWLLILQANGQEFRFESAGARVGISGDSTSENFLQGEAFLNYNLWRWELNPRWQLQSRIDLSAGWLGNRGYDAALGTIGPSLLLSRSALPISLEGGFHPTFISRDRFGSTDLGSRVQFTSHIGLNWDVTSYIRLGYRYQHMSDAGIREPNPGFNLHVFSIGYLF